MRPMIMTSQFLKHAAPGQPILKFQNITQSKDIQFDPQADLVLMRFAVIMELPAARGY